MPHHRGAVFETITTATRGVGKREEKEDTVKLFVGGLAWATDDVSLRAAFQSFGNVVDAVVIKDRETGRSRGFGFVSFSDNASGTAALQAMNGAVVDGRAGVHPRAAHACAPPRRVSCRVAVAILVRDPRADELRALRRELTRLRQENDILKKAAVILGTKPQPNSEP